MKKRTILLIVIILLIVGVIYSIESSNKDTELISKQSNAKSEKVESTNYIKPNEERIKSKSENYEKAIELVNPDGFINTESITIEENIGKKVILIDFWTYSCINCQRSLPYVVSWHEKYEDEGLLVIGVHTPEFEFEKKYDNVLEATNKWDIEYPVVQDNDKKTFRAYKNRYWPRKYLIDIDGFIRYDRIGEGAYDITENKIKELLAERKEILNK